MKLGELARALGLELRGDGELEIAAAVPIEAAAPGTVSFVSQPRYLANVGAGFSFMRDRFRGDGGPGALRGPDKCNPALDFARTLGIFYPPYRPNPALIPPLKLHPG